MKTNETPSWVKREVRRLAAMAAMGGSASAAGFEWQAMDLRRKYGWPDKVAWPFAIKQPMA